MPECSFRESGWVWEGLATHAGVRPTLYGVGEGWRWFDVPGVNFMFHPNTEVAFAKLRDAPRVVADISKWQFDPVRNEGGGEIGFVGTHDARPERIRAEAENLSRLAVQFPHVAGGIIDDASNMFAHESYASGGAALPQDALRLHNPDLKLWVVVYTHQLDQPEWDLLKPHMDVVNLWLWDCQEISRLADHVAHCRECFPTQEIIVGSYLHDFPSRTHMPLDLLQLQYETMLRLWESGAIAGFNILGAFYIDQAVAQAEWVREFLTER